MVYKNFLEQYNVYEKKCLEVLKDVIKIDLRYFAVGPCEDGIEFVFTDDFTKGLQCLHVPINILNGEYSDEEYKQYIEEMKELF